MNRMLLVAGLARLALFVSLLTAGEPAPSWVQVTDKAAPKTGGNVINLMDALKRSLASEQPSPAPAKAKGKKSRKAAAGQREMLLPISGKRTKEETKKAGKPARAPARSRKAG